MNTDRARNGQRPKRPRKVLYRAIGISVHTGWGACVIVGGSLLKPEIVDNKVIDLLDDAERFCFHRAAEMEGMLALEWLACLRAKALAKARSELVTLMNRNIRVGAIVAKDGIIPDLEVILASHIRIHRAEGFFYRDVFRDACQIPCQIISPTSLNIATMDKLPTKPWGRDQKLAALAAWRALDKPINQESQQ